MKDHVYKLIELTGTSTTSIEDAVAKAIQRAHKTIKNLGWFQVVETRGNIDKGKVQHWQVTIKVGFTVEGWKDRKTVETKWRSFMPQGDKSSYTDKQKRQAEHI